MADFIPAGDDARKTWATAFSTKIATHGAAVGLTPGLITTTQARCSMITQRIDDKAAKKNAWQASAAACSTGNQVDLTALRATIAAIKTHSGYSEEIGADLGIIGPADLFDPNTYQAELREVRLSMPSQVTVAFGKAKGNIDGVNVYSRRQGTAPWTFLARDTESPYIDTTPLAQAGQPEIREYRIRAVIDDEEIGDYSVTKQVTVS